MIDKTKVRAIRAWAFKNAIGVRAFSFSNLFTDVKKAVVALLLFSH